LAVIHFLTKGGVNVKLLVPIDGSKASLYAFEKAVEIAKNYHFSMKVLSVVNVRAVSDDRADLVDLMIKDVNDNMDKLIKSTDLTGIDVKTEVVYGVDYTTILDVAERDNVDLIVIGNRGQSRIERFFLGSVANRVIAESKCPVLVIHTEA
jgi:nucleotide-binding universal stress UspA family protein